MRTVTVVYVMAVPIVCTYVDVNGSNVLISLCVDVYNYDGSTVPKSVYTIMMEFRNDPTLQFNTFV